MGDETIVITGGSRGIGRAVTVEFLGAGASVVVCARDVESLESIADEIDGDSERADLTTIRADVRDEFDVERLMEQAARAGGGTIDLVIANAGVNHGTPGEMPLGSESYSRFDDTIRTNLRGVFSTIREAIPHLDDDGRILVPSGSVARDAKPGMGAYAASKAGAEAIVRGFAVDIEQSVCVIDPGVVATDLTGTDRARDPEDVAPMFYWAGMEADAESIDGEVVDLRTWKRSTR